MHFITGHKVRKIINTSFNISKGMKLYIFDDVILFEIFGKRYQLGEQKQLPQGMYAGGRGEREKYCNGMPLKEGSAVARGNEGLKEKSNFSSLETVVKDTPTTPEKTQDNYQT